ncbi:hypothetical protein F511_28830 [Dorcoceras hygrometricum]|uniref:Reverse transcriptase RNase H-like domain-containing protein n=1 Tax=Dorcoceras hygrometricum TaxID=472368 RepID=A0A2Z7DIH1_9LAMI|nr:hypothetical protein F511_28830 [Dorcoceras hygrometricum]
MAKISDGRYGKGEQLTESQMPFHMGKQNFQTLRIMAKITDGRYGKGEQLTECQMPFHMGKRWRHYLYGEKCEIFTDHKSLKYFFT